MTFSSKKVKPLLKTFRNAFTLLRKNNPLMLASSTAFFATFSLAPIIVITVNALSIYFNDQEISSQLFQKINNIFGKQTAQQIESIVNNFQSIEGKWWITVGGTLFLFFVATTLLRIIKLAIHQLWHITKTPSNRLRYNLRERLISAGLILFIGILFASSLLLDATVVFLQDYIKEIIPFMDAALVQALNYSFSLVVVTAWFTIIYKVLPDARVSWKVAFPGALLTGILFYLGQFGLGKLLVYSNIVTFFGASASIALLLLFIFYSSFLIYFGAAFTYSYGQITGRAIEPGKYADEYEIKLVSQEG